MVSLETFSADNAISQAYSLKKLVSQEQSWLKIVQPDTVKRYQSLLKGAQNIARIAGHKREIEASVIMRGRVAVGIATRIFNQMVIHPEEGKVIGDDLDYWLKQGEPLGSHQEIARLLVGRDGPKPVFATVRTDHPQPAIGFAYEMEPVGEVASLSTERPDTFDVTWSGAPVQLYAHNRPLS